MPWRENVDTILKVGGFVAAVGIGAYVVKTVVNPSPNCADPNSACYQAIQPYTSEMATCSAEYTQIMNEVVKGGTLTQAQQNALDQAKACMDDASKNIATTSTKYGQGSELNQLLDYLGVTGAIVLFLKYGLPGISGFYKSLKAGGGISTPPRGGGGIAATIANTSILFGIQQGYISAAQAQDLSNGVESIESDNVAAVNSLWNELLAESVVDQAVAISNINLLTNSINADTTGVLNALAGL